MNTSLQLHIHAMTGVLHNQEELGQENKINASCFKFIAPIKNPGINDSSL